MAYVKVLVMALEVIRVFNNQTGKKSTNYSHLPHLFSKDGKRCKGFESYTN